MIGDVFQIPLDGNAIVVGQVVGVYQRRAYYLAVFEPKLDSRAMPSLEVAVSAPLLFLALTFDAKFVHGDWGLIGHLPVRSDLPMPAYKEAVSPRVFEVVDYSGRLRRPAREHEANWLPNRKVVSPALLEKAIRAHHGLEPWLPEWFEGLAPNESATTRRLFGD